MQKVNGELEIDIDDKLLHKTWKVERTGWIIMLLFVLAGLFGFFGRGGYSNAVKESEDQSIKVEYQRFLRYHTDDKMVVEIQRKAEETTLKLFVGNELINKVKIEKIIPEPVKTELQSDGIIFSFDVSAGASSKEISFYLKPQSIGNVNTVIREVGGSTVNFSQFIYP